ncbi:URACIL PHOSPHORIBOSYLTRANSFERASE (UMP PYROPHOSPHORYLASE) (UPRTASE) [Mycoplasmopsis pulmonis]|uniref:Uracil phosphoribosyltransferase n=1 Tax=Mycoplasmopsis pulmonis (strain UAB CTIP) TaxID=272635 RepID=UPP_MYCPU|nr:uracil phosphoribosyltransferase [Mycoplasmopsis pulmonis]Q98QP6.1 RecName: Full=Uracil phosphoribosyltransferase; AltName: Full=UMP pyrophosphorylase; AltName: Full=UPRTase [Mycoplasmopsis pulmonis UAB CTIP]MDZ7293275.1 uracil phosphoribosyltransferase [Mycoplasmopsis pulmonis]CAC13488.1 URACIL PHOSPHORIBOSYLTRANSFERASE (UMP PYROPHOSPHORYLASE) (UPRTASE) [Mycoplasmopsis pulmonis]VEU68080.1 uracil phosphoribosyltransferase [Mycoplasmopsis pulmonis]
MLKVIDHPLIKQKLSVIRSQKAGHDVFRKNVIEIASLMTYEVFRNYKLKEIKIDTPVAQDVLAYDYDKEIVIVAILRAGLAMVPGIVNLLPKARVGHIGIFRDEKTFEPNNYFYKIPDVPKDSEILIVDPMLATGNSAVYAIERLKKDGFKNIRLLSLVGVQEGVDNIEKNVGKDFPIFLGSLDEKLNDKKYIVPGLGDAGDRIFGTK